MKCAFLTPGNFERGMPKMMYEGLIALGFEVDQHNPNAWGPGCYRDADMALSMGYKAAAAMVLGEYAEHGRPTLVVDLGYMDRATSHDSGGYYQVGLGRLGWVPGFDVPSDRLEALNVHIIEKRDAPKKSYVLICSQKFGDAQHRMDEKSVKRWCGQMIANAKAWAPDLEIVFRPHPKSLLEMPGIRLSDPRVESIEDAVAGAAFVVTHNSTVGVECIRQSVPVLCSDSAHYFELSSGDPLYETAWQNPRAAEYDDRRVYLERLAYSQWTKDEISSGKAFTFALYAAGFEIRDTIDGKILVPREASVAKQEEPMVEEMEAETEPQPQAGEQRPSANAPQMKKVVTMSRDELMDELEARGVEYSKRWPFDKLADLVKKARKNAK